MTWSKAAKAIACPTDDDVTAHHQIAGAMSVAANPQTRNRLRRPIYVDRWPAPAIAMACATEAIPMVKDTLVAVNPVSVPKRSVSNSTVLFVSNHNPVM